MGLCLLLNLHSTFHCSSYPLSTILFLCLVISSVLSRVIVTLDRTGKESHIHLHSPFVIHVNNKEKNRGSSIQSRNVCEINQYTFS